MSIKVLKGQQRSQ